jgi:DnaK suppressor protein
MTTASTYLARQLKSAPSELTGDQLATLRALLTEALVDQRAHVEQNEALAISLTADTDDDVGRDRETARFAADRARDAVAELEHALDRVDDCTYGTCEACERPIPFERLVGVTGPWCGTAQERVHPASDGWRVAAALRSTSPDNRRAVGRSLSPASDGPCCVRVLVSAFANQEELDAQVENPI